MIVDILIGIIAALHVWFLALEMFLWQKPIGLKIFNNSKEKAKSTAVLAANQGLYNGFLVAGLIWGLLAQDPIQAHSIKVFFLSCVLIAGIYGGITASRKILWVQGLPALIALGLLFIF